MDETYPHLIPLIYIDARNPAISQTTPPPIARTKPVRSIPAASSCAARYSMTSSFLLPSPGVTEITGALGNPLPYNLITLSSVIIIVPFSGSSPDTASHLSRPVFPI